MRKLKDGPETGEYRATLIQFLNEYNLNGMAILAMAREVVPYSYAPGEFILKQDEQSQFICFLLSGKVRILLKDKGRPKSVGTLEPVTMLGEIAYFNSTPASATVKVEGKTPAVVFRISYSSFTMVLERFPDVRATLSRIGDMRVLKHFHGFISYRKFMEMIGWRKDRFAVNRAFSQDLDFALGRVFRPAIKKNAKILEVGDGPGLVAELLYDSEPKILDNLSIQATYLEEAITNALTPQPSDFSRAHGLEERFDAIVALQVFNVVSRHAVEEQFQIAHSLLKNGGVLFAVKLQLLDIRHDSGTSGSLIFNALEELVEYTWPGAIGTKNLIETSFIDADLDPIMEWNKAFCRKAVAGKLKIPKSSSHEDRVMLNLLLKQVDSGLFDPEDLHYQWLGWKAEQYGFKSEASEKNTETAFFYQLLRKS
ncbi:MAG: cyclic nucleotide-binding domain-containing protein [SAR324 cluster bacterium]|nr:cyclic nucleotide-binding domain-containing protein [SAR324 cluster bacterium]